MIVPKRSICLTITIVALNVLLSAAARNINSSRPELGSTNQNGSDPIIPFESSSADADDDG